MKNFVIETAEYMKEEARQVSKKIWLIIFLIVYSGIAFVYRERIEQLINLIISKIPIDIPPIIVFFLLSILVIWISYIVFLSIIFSKKTLQMQTLLTPNNYVKEKVFILLPVYPSDGSMGDGILQSAGFLAARDEFHANLELEFFDHQNDTERVRDIIEKIFDKVVSEELARINIVSTMSTVYKVVKAQVDFFSAKLNVKDKVSVVFTVSAAPNIPADGKFYFQYFISGQREAKTLINYCEIVKDILTPNELKIFLLKSTAKYPSETIEMIRNGLDNKLSVELVDIQNNVLFPEYKRKYSIFIVIAYDKELFDAIKYLASVDYKGIVLVSATLSVDDWREYLNFEENFHIRKLDIKYINIDNFPCSLNDGCKIFETKLDKWSLDAVLESDIYTESLSETKEKRLTELELKVYEKLLTNYISAFCYDSIRLFNTLALKSDYQNLADLFSKKNNILDEAPFTDMRMTHDGKALLDLTVERMLFTVRNKDILIVVDVQKDFCKGGALAVEDSETLIKPLNKTIKEAEQNDFLIIYTQDWHPNDHYSFQDNGGQWEKHCVQDSNGAEFHDDLYFAEDAIYVKTGYEKGLEGYSPYEDPVMSRYINSISGTVYVTGIALEYCVKHTCIDSIKHNKEVVAIEPLIRSIETDGKKLKSMWKTLIDLGVQKTDKILFE